DCVTVDPMPGIPTPTPSGPDTSGPYGVTGTGLLAKLTLDPGPLLPGSLLPPATTLDLSGSFLNDTPDFPADLSPISATVLSSSLRFLYCADVNGDGNVDLLTDILGIIQHYAPTGGSPYDPAFDINNDGVINLLDDILGAIQHYLVPC
ncbi:MAG: dockerin type I domain-containing protein, partial [Pirellulales bacterium]